MLVYLQSQTPAIIHRDIKPENILIDSDNQVYLVNFGLARQGGAEIAPSSMIKGTMGFMPPEQLFNRELTTASDLYGLGVTLICLLTGIKSVDIGGLIDTDYHHINTGNLPAIPQFNYLFLCLVFLISIIIGYIINVFGNNPGVLFLLSSFLVSYIVIAEEDFFNSKDIENFNHRKMFVISNVILLSFICSMVLLVKNSYLLFSHSFYLLITTINTIACLNYLMAKKSNINLIYVVYLSIIAIVVALLVVRRGIGALFLAIIIFALILTYHLTTILMASSLRLLIMTFAELYSSNIYPVDNSIKIAILTLTLGLVLGSQIPILNNFNYAHLVYIVILSTTLSSIIYLLVKNIITPILETRRLQKLQKLYLEKHLQLLKP